MCLKFSEAHSVCGAYRFTTFSTAIIIIINIINVDRHCDNQQSQQSQACRTMKAIWLFEAHLIPRHLDTHRQSQKKHDIMILFIPHAVWSGLFTKKTFNCKSQGASTVIHWESRSSGYATHTGVPDRRMLRLFRESSGLPGTKRKPTPFSRKLTKPWSCYCYVIPKGSKGYKYFQNPQVRNPKKNFEKNLRRGVHLRTATTNMG